MSAVFLFVLASLSDYYDGVLARRFGVRSRLGQYLDPLADKVLILGTFIALALEAPDLVPWWAVVAIALRDVVVTIFRSWAEATGQMLPTYRMAKGKTMLQILFLFAILVLRAAAHTSPPLQEAARWILYESQLPGLALIGVVGFTLATGALYAVAPVKEQMDSE
jgi:CDP-diacylglycerol--glycerol-3-phosphate 3-phosphatidyltransferase